MSETDSTDETGTNGGGRRIPVRDVKVKTVTVEVAVLTVGDVPMSLLVYQQLPQDLEFMKLSWSRPESPDPSVEQDPRGWRLDDAGDVWGHVNIHDQTCPEDGHVHVVYTFTYEEQTTLMRGTVASKGFQEQAEWALRRGMPRDVEERLGREWVERFFRLQGTPQLFITG
jgi:hypothetical protein